MEENLRKCVHCGFCLPSCPTYLVVGDERESPRGRIYLIKNMLESGDTPGREIVTHIDSCLSCLACVSACPSGVDYQHYIDYARNYIEDHYSRPPLERFLRSVLVYTLTHIDLFRIGLKLAKFAKPFSEMFSLKLATMIRMVPTELKAQNIGNAARVFPAEGRRIKRVALLMGCAQNVLRPSINEATIRLLTRMGMEVVVTEGVGCCGALNHHIGENDKAQDLAKSNIRVNSVCPTFVLTPMVKRFFKNKKFMREMIRNIPLGRVAEQSDVATSVAFLASDSSSMITGSSIMVDGGWTAQ